MEDFHVKSDRPSIHLVPGRLLDASEASTHFQELASEGVPQALSAAGYSILNPLPRDLLDLFTEDERGHETGFGLLVGPRGGTYGYLTVQTASRQVSWLVPFARLKARQWLARSLAAGRFVFGFTTPDIMQFAVRSLWHPELLPEERQRLDDAAAGDDDEEPGLEYVELLIELHEKPSIAHELPGTGIEERWLVAVDVVAERVGSAPQKAKELAGKQA